MGYHPSCDGSTLHFRPQKIKTAGNEGGEKISFNLEIVEFVRKITKHLLRSIIRPSAVSVLLLGGRIVVGMSEKKNCNLSFPPRTPAQCTALIVPFRAPCTASNYTGWDIVVGINLLKRSVGSEWKDLLSLAVCVCVSVWVVLFFFFIPPPIHDRLKQIEWRRHRLLLQFRWWWYCARPLASLPFEHTHTQSPCCKQQKKTSNSRQPSEDYLPPAVRSFAPFGKLPMG